MDNTLSMEKCMLKKTHKNKIRLLALVVSGAFHIFFEELDRNQEEPELEAQRICQFHGTSQSTNNYCGLMKRMGILDHLACLLRNLYAGQKATVRNGHGTTDWFQIGKGICQGCILPPCLFNLYAEYIM